MALWDDATTPYIGQQGSDNSSLWGWLTSLFSGRQPQAQQPQTAPSTQVYTGPQVNPSLYPGSTPTGGDWTSGPASLRYAPPSLYTAGNPQQQAQWNQTSTPQGWAALAAQAANAPAMSGGAGTVSPPPAPTQPAPLGDISTMTSAEIEAIPDAVYNNMTEAQRTQLTARWMALNPNR